MMMQFSSDHDLVAFDLDDTLYKEIDFLHSAYRHIAQTIGHPEAYEYMIRWYEQGKNVFQLLIRHFSLDYSLEQLLELYRFHEPDITLDSTVAQVIKALHSAQIPMAVITDGRSRTQRTKIHALGLNTLLSAILISEEIGYTKPHPEAFLRLQESFPSRRYTYVADNTAKDFLAPNQLGWATVCLLDNGRNIHPQTFDLPTDYLPRHRITTLTDLLL